jgi:hypothetical protein
MPGQAGRYDRPRQARRDGNAAAGHEDGLVLVSLVLLAHRFIRGAGAAMNLIS